MEPVYELVLGVVLFSAGGGVVRTLRDAFKRRQNNVVPVFDVYDIFFDVTLGAASGSAVFLATSATTELITSIDAGVGFMLVCAGYAGADLIDGVLGKGMEAIKTIVR